MLANCNVILRGDKSFVYDLDVQRGIVSSRVALLLRSAEIKLLLADLCERANKSCVAANVSELIEWREQELRSSECERVV